MIITAAIHLIGIMIIFIFILLIFINIPKIIDIISIININFIENYLTIIKLKINLFQAHYFICNEIYSLYFWNYHYISCFLNNYDFDILLAQFGNNFSLNKYDFDYLLYLRLFYFNDGFFTHKNHLNLYQDNFSSFYLWTWFKNH
jgi:hypothetical protein